MAQNKQTKHVLAGRSQTQYKGVIESSLEGKKVSKVTKEKTGKGQKQRQQVLCEFKVSLV